MNPVILAGIVIVFSALALGLLALLDRYQSVTDRADADRRTGRGERRTAAGQGQVYYDAFADHPRSPHTRETPHHAA